MIPVILASLLLLLVLISRRYLRQGIICAWCKKVERTGVAPYTHGMCTKCFDRELAEFEAHH